MDMSQPVGVTPLDIQPHGPVGQPIDRVDGPLKVTGRAPYAYESREMKHPGYGFVVTATIAKGRIRDIDTATAERMPGVVHVLTHRNAPAQGEKKEQVGPLLTDTEIRHWGQPVALVVAESFEEARA
ncbi:hypothetical protein VQ03_30060, partial [Methylobacterium tarhaniae]